MPIVQAVTISGTYPENCRWPVPTLENLREGHQFQIVLRTKDKNLAAAVSRMKVHGVQVEREQAGYAVTLAFVVFEVRHMLEVPEDEDDGMEVDSLALVKPSNRTVEAVLLWFKDKSAADPRLMDMMRQEISAR